MSSPPATLPVESPTSSALPDRAQVVVVGGGIVGASVAYHLTKLGVTDVAILERHELTSGTTWHAAGLVAQLRATENLTRLAQYSLELYKNLENETGQATGFRAPGAISLASTATRWEELRRTAAMARYLGVEAEEIGPREIQDKFPMCEVSDVAGGIWLPQDGAVGPSDVTQALAKGARMGGANMYEGTGVDDLIVEDGRVVGVITDNGERIECDTVVLACGLWTRHLAAKHGVQVPLHAAHHYYVVTEPIEGLDAEWPILRDPDHFAYLKPEAGGSMLVGLFEPVASPWPAAGPPPTDKSFITLEPASDHLAEFLPATFDRIPIIHETGLRLIFDGPESFTPDNSYILGEAPNLRGMFVAAGFNSIGIQSAGGAGMALAHWIVNGEPHIDLADVDIRRFEPFHGTEKFLRDRTVEGLGLLYAPHWPHRQYETGRDIRRSPLHDRLEEKGACFGSMMGWERPNFFARPELGIEARYEYSWGRQNWHEANELEHNAVRETAGLFDLSSFAKFLVQGRDAAAVLSRMSSGPVAGEVGGSVYTQWLNRHGGIEADLTISRISEREFWVIGGAGTRSRDLLAIERALASHADGEGGERAANATVTDITSAFAVLAVMGPGSREIVQGVTQADMSDEAFPFATNQLIDAGGCHVRANRMSYVGELGWELFVPTEFAVHVFDQLMDAGTPLGMELAGYHTLNSLRFEKGYRHWGHELTPDDTPLQAGLSFAVDWEKDFVGKEALVAQKTKGNTRRLVQVAVHDESVLLHHNEPLYRDGLRVGYVTGGMWGHTVDAAVGMAWAYRPADEVEAGELATAAWINEGTWQIEIPGRMVDALVQLRPWL
jgi:glycine cleavage system aminomethyltransferase T/glycine/D-amino acid oxidase-like deaminating enzyme